MSRRRGLVGQGASRALRRARLGEDTRRPTGKDEERLWRLTPRPERFELDAGKELQAVSSCFEGLKGKDGDFGPEAPR